MALKPLTILLTGSTGYIGRRLLPVLLGQGHTVICLVRDKRRFDYDDFSSVPVNQLQVVEADLTHEESIKSLPTTIDLAFYLIHSMSSEENFLEAEKKSAEIFVDYIDQTTAKQIIYLSGIVNDGALSKHLSSRKNVEDILSRSKASLTVLRAAIIIGSGSASFEIIRDLVEKLPVMITPKWLKSRCQPIGIRNVIEYLIGVMVRE
ncbi:MAG: NAD(P)H-binding protein, partial [Cyclobacteriaceae bacterium]|nr:NAD(P)H-binding protein [Cyclobacteriaceae bacterium]